MTSQLSPRTIMGVIQAMDSESDKDPSALPILANLIRQYRPPDELQLTSEIVDFHHGELYGPWARLAAAHGATDEEVLRGLFGVSVRRAYETWPTDKPVPKIAVMVRAIEREEMYFPGATPLLVRLCDATGEILASFQEKIFKKYPVAIQEKTVLVLKNVPIFHRSRFGKSFLVSLQCISQIYPERNTDIASTAETQYETNSASLDDDAEQNFPSETVPSAAERRPFFFQAGGSADPVQTFPDHLSSLDCLDVDDDDTAPTTQ